MYRDNRRRGIGCAVGVMRRILAAIVCMCVAGGASAGDWPADADGYWPQWRGPNANGVAPKGDPPVEWSESKNVRWKVEVPGVGNATPIVWGDRVYIQSAVKTDRKAEVKAEARAEAEQPSQRGRGRRGRGRRGGNWMGSSTPTNVHQFTMFALDRRTGKTVWQTVLREALPHEGGHRDASQASNSPVTDGEHVFAYFGSRGLYCLDMQGKVVWKKDFGQMRTVMGFGEGSSPTLYGDTIVVNFDHEGDSFIVALDKASGEQRWRVERDERTSWATPLVVTAGGKPQVVTSATGLIRSYDLASGKLIWQCGGLTRNVIPSPVSGDGLLYAMSGFRGNALRAIRFGDAKGDISDSSAVAWQYDGKGTPYTPSPLLYGELLYFLDNNRAILSCFDAGSGKQHYIQQRLEGVQGAYASPVGAAGRVYIAGRNGVTAVVKRGAKFELLGANTLDDSFTASPAIVDNEIYLRGRKHLYCIAAD